MRLAVKLLATGSTLNNFKQVPLVKIARGETCNLLLQLVDLDNNGQRYSADPAATLEVIIPRSYVTSADPNQANARLYTDPSIDRFASVAFSDDRSIWSFPLVSQDTTNMISDSLKVILTEPSGVKIAYANQVIKMIDGQES